MKTEARPPSRRVAEVRAAVNRERLLDTAVRLIRKPSPTGEAGAAADELAAILVEDGFQVERLAADHDQAPAVVTRLTADGPGRSLQFNGHLDTVHLPHVPPKIVGDRISGSGSADMKGGIAAAVEALRALRDSGCLVGGSLLLTAHELHELPWGDGRQLESMIRQGYVGDAVLIPEYFNSALPVVGRGGLIWSATIGRPGPPIHEVYRPNEPSVIAIGAELVRRLEALGLTLSGEGRDLTGSPDLFIGMIRSGSIYNEYPQTCRLEGTRRWLPGTCFEDADRELRQLCRRLADETGVGIEIETNLMKDAFELNTDHEIVPIFLSSYHSLTGKTLPLGGKPFVDDGNTFWTRKGIPAITHGPTSGGAHTTAEWASVNDLVRVAELYALVAAEYCPGNNNTVCL